MAEFGFVEDSVRQHFVEIINEIIREEGLPLERADAQIEIVERDERGIVKRVRFPDVVIWKKGAALVEGALLIELKQPYYSPFTVEIVEDAFVKASKVGIPYFATCNMRRLILFESTPSDNKLAPLMERRIKVYDLSPMRKARDILRGDIRKILKKNLRECLLEFKDIYMGVKKLPTFPLDELFILNLRDIVSSLSDAFCEALINSFKSDNKFRRGFQKWFAEQGWIPPLNVSEIEKFEQAARQYLYLLAVKLMFYYALKKKMPKLPDIDVPDSIDNGVALKLWLQNYFNLAVEISQDYETIFGMNFIEKFPVPDGAVDSLKRFIRGLRRYDFDKLGYADLGKIFDKLIPREERHTLGQYFTTQRHRDGTYWPDVVDLILGFTVRSPDAKILDGACGAGTFLVRAYARLKHLKPDLSHEDLLTRLYGVDISKFAALLSAVNLAIRDLSVEENYPIILNEDFFNVSAGEELGKWVDVKQRIMLLTKGKKRSLKLPYVRAFVGNPPYTRQEEMEEYIEDYKEKLADVVEKEWKIKLGKRSSIYVYFMLHGFKFLEEGGRLGYITSNSWLDVDYGKYLQEFFLKNSKIIAIVESKVERWFEDADINTAITIVEKCEDKKERNDNLVRFVQLKKKLEDIIPTSNEDDRWEAIDRLVKKIESVREYYEDEMIRVFPKKQEELWNEGYDEESGKYVGSKWGKYIRAPEIFFKILEKAGDKLIPLEKIATVKRGFTTGANEFFYLKDEDIRRWGIEREFWMHPVTRKEWEKIKDLIPEEDIWLDKNGEYFKRSQYAEKYKLDDVLVDGSVIWIPNYVVKSPRECRSIIVDPKHLKYRVLMIHKDKEELKGTNVLKYIEWGEEQGFHERPTCKSRQRWYDLGDRSPAKILFLRATEDRPAIYFSEVRLFHDQTFYSITSSKKVVASLLNSTLTNFFFREILSGAGTALGLGALWSAVYEAANLPILDFKKLSNTQIKKINKIFDKLASRPVGSVFEEIGASSQKEVSLNGVKPDRRKLDEIIMGEVLGLTDKEQEEVYKAVIDLVRSRIQRAKSVKRSRKIKGIDVEQLARDVIRQLNLKILPKFPIEFIKGLEIERTVSLPEGRDIKLESTLDGIYLNISGEKIPCPSPEEANYLYWSAVNGLRKVPIPKDREAMKKAVKEFEELYHEQVSKLDEWLKVNIPKAKERKAIRRKAIQFLLQKKDGG